MSKIVMKIWKNEIRKVGCACVSEEIFSEEGPKWIGAGLMGSISGWSWLEVIGFMIPSGVVWWFAWSIKSPLSASASSHVHLPLPLHLHIKVLDFLNQLFSNLLDLIWRYDWRLRVGERFLLFEDFVDPLPDFVHVVWVHVRVSLRNNFIKQIGKFLQFRVE